TTARARLATGRHQHGIDARCLRCRKQHLPQLRRDWSVAYLALRVFDNDRHGATLPYSPIQGPMIGRRQKLARDPFHSWSPESSRPVHNGRLALPPPAMSIRVPMPIGIITQLIRAELDLC